VTPSIKTLHDAVNERFSGMLKAGVTGTRICLTELSLDQPSIMAGGRGGREAAARPQSRDGRVRLKPQSAIPRSGDDGEIGKVPGWPPNVMVAGPVSIGAHAVAGVGLSCVTSSPTR
jgi:hypothetical protein